MLGHCDFDLTDVGGSRYQSGQSAALASARLFGSGDYEGSSEGAASGGVVSVYHLAKFGRLDVAGADWSQVDLNRDRTVGGRRGVLRAGLYGWLLRQPEFKETLARELPWILGGIVALKLCAAAAIGTVLRRRSLLTSIALGAAALPWLAIVLIVFGVAGYLTEWTWYLAAGAALLVPLTSLAAAPLRAGLESASITAD